MATSPSSGGEAGYSSLREAVNRILGTPGGEDRTLGSLGTGTPAQTSDIQLGTKSAVENTPFEDPNVTAQKKSLADAQAITAGMQSQLSSLNTPVAAAPAAAPVSTAPAPQQMISKAALYELQKQNQMAEYDRKRAEQQATLKASGLYSPNQLNFKPTNWGNLAQPADWGKPGSYSYNYMNNTMVANPYAK